MKLLGDASQEDKEIAEQLVQAELESDHDRFLSKERKAQIYVCLAHDWFGLDMEEEGNRLLVKADKISPGYFSSTVIQHQKEDKQFDHLVKNITIKLISLFVYGTNKP